MKRFVKSLVLQAAFILALLAGPTSVQAFEPFLGEVRWVGFNFAPRGWALCDGQLLPISQNQALFALLGTLHGGDGRTTFALPDMRGRAMLGFGNGPELSFRQVGSKGGAERHTLVTNEMPAHTHSLRAGERGDDVKPDGRNISGVGRFRMFDSGAASRDMSSAAIENTGGGQSHNNMQPFVTAYCIIALQGVFPSRN